MNYQFEDPQIRRLKDELYSARQTILGLAPQAIRDEFTSYYRCESRSDSHKWKREIIQKVIAIAKPDQNNTWEKRAYCPLCGHGSSSPYSEGFTLPIGLERHLEGYGQVHQCGVMKALFALAQDYFDDKFTESERLEREKAQAEVARRRTVELLYQVDPCEEPQLIDEGYHYGKSPRDEAGMKWAEQRLTDIGFLIIISENIKHCTWESPGFIVFADLRFAGEISFRVYKAPLPKRRNPRLRSLTSFSIPDSWKNNIKAKFLERLPAPASKNDKS